MLVKAQRIAPQARGRAYGLKENLSSLQIIIRYLCSDCVIAGNIIIKCATLHLLLKLLCI